MRQPIFRIPASVHRQLRRPAGTGGRPDGLLLLRSPAQTRPIHCGHLTEYSMITPIKPGSGPDRKPFLPDSPARTRFAPSPTGHLHLGSLRTALFNYLLARRTGGQFLLRIEDTDQKRTIEGAEQRLMDDLHWAGIEWDEGPAVGGPYGPYRQSDRTSLYQAHVEQLIASGHAYRCFCTPERLYQLAETRHKLGLPTDYDRHCFHLSAEESDEKAAAGAKHVVRLKSPKKYPAFDDLVYGTIGKKKKSGPGMASREDRFAALDAFDDPILLKSDGQPTYHLANVVDDHHMDITHVIRGSEWLIATPKHVALYEAFGWQPPKFAHVGLLVDESGNKLSKRNLDDIGISNFRSQGILPEALLNFVALLGWSHDKKSDVMDVEELSQLFNLRFTKGNTILDMSKLAYLQPRHAALRAKRGGAPFKELVDKVSAAVHASFKPDSYRALLGSRTLSRYVSQLLVADASNYASAESFVDRNRFFFDPAAFPPVAAESLPLPAGYLLDLASAVTARPGEGEEWTAELAQGRISAEIGRTVERLAAGQDGSDGLDRLWTGTGEPPSKREVSACVYHFLRDVIFGGRDGPPVGLSMQLVGRNFCSGRVEEARLLLGKA